MAKSYARKLKELSYEELLKKQDQLVIFRTHTDKYNLRGQIIEQDGQLMMCFSLWLTDIDQLKDLGLSIHDFAPQDPITELLQLLKFQNLTTQDLSRQTTELRKAKKTAEKALKIRRDFLSVMTHEIRTPLNAIIGMSNILFEETPKPEQLEHLNTLKFSADNLLSLVNDILDFSKMEAGKMELRKTEVALENLVRQMVKSLESKTQGKDLHLRAEIDQELPEYVWLDEGRFCQILMNLIGNAIKFTDQGEVKVHVRSLNRQTGSKEKADTVDIEVLVEDTGIGIPKDKLGRILDPFMQVESSNSRKYEGTGLGLAITQKLLRLFGSKVVIESEVGKGSVFRFQLCLELADRPKTRADSSEAGKISTGSNKGIPRVLLVEDNVVNVKIVSRYLSKWGVDYDVCYNGVEALEKAQTGVYDLILMDLLMPVKDGYETSREIRSLPLAYTQEVPIVALSASLFEEVEQKVFESGMTDFFNKPFRPAELKALVQKYSQTQMIL